MKRKSVYHATKNKNTLLLIFKEGVKPKRLPSVYVFRKLRDALKFAREFGYFAVIHCFVEKGQTERKWKAKYGEVWKMKKGEMVSVGKKYWLI